MSKAIQINDQRLIKIERLLTTGDVAHLDTDERVDFINRLCKLIGVSPLLQPFDFIKAQGKTVPYANKNLAAWLRHTHKISIKITSRERVDGLYVITAQAKTAAGKEDESIGAINIKGLAGQDLANALMKAETKAKRRVTLSITGLGMLDEVEANEMAEREVKHAAEQKVEQVEQKLAAPTVEESPEDRGYVIKSGRNKGKPLSDCKEKALRDWLKIYDQKKQMNLETHPDLDEDAFYIRAHLDGLTLEKESGGSSVNQPDPKETADDLNP